MHTEKRRAPGLPLMIAPMRPSHAFIRRARIAGTVALEDAELPAAPGADPSKSEVGDCEFYATREFAGARLATSVHDFASVNFAD